MSFQDILALRNKDLDGISLEPFEATSHDLNIARKIATTKVKTPSTPKYIKTIYS